MEKNYIIAWKSLANGRIGRGKNLFEQREALRTAAELNREHPGFDHIAVAENEENLTALFNAKPPPEKILTLHSFPETHHTQSMENRTEEPSVAEQNILSIEPEEEIVNPVLDDELTGT